MDKLVTDRLVVRFCNKICTRRARKILGIRRPFLRRNSVIIPEDTYSTVLVLMLHCMNGITKLDLTPR